MLRPSYVIGYGYHQLALNLNTVDRSGSAGLSSRESVSS